MVLDKSLTSLECGGLGGGGAFCGRINASSINGCASLHGGKAGCRADGIAAGDVAIGGAERGAGYRAYSLEGRILV